jgi:hypothetical protein
MKGAPTFENYETVLLSVLGSVVCFVLFELGQTPGLRARLYRQLKSYTCASALCLLLCSDAFGAPRSSRIRNHDRGVGILLGLRMRVQAFAPKSSGKQLTIIPPLDGGTARVLRLRGVPDPCFANTCSLRVCAVMESRDYVGLGYYTQPCVGSK